MTGLIISLLIAINICLWIELKFKYRYLKALKEISNLGAVCDDFENCNHKQCKDSAAAVLIALEAIKNTEFF